MRRSSMRRLRSRCSSRRWKSCTSSRRSWCSTRRSRPELSGRHLRWHQRCGREDHRNAGALGPSFHREKPKGFRLTSKRGAPRRPFYIEPFARALIAALPNSVRRPDIPRGSSAPNLPARAHAEPRRPRRAAIPNSTGYAVSSINRVRAGHLGWRLYAASLEIVLLWTL